jgi:hypothetical protein
MTVDMVVLTIGSRIYVDSFGGLIPAEITGYTPRGRIAVRFTSSGGGWSKGDTDEISPKRCVPPQCVVRRGHHIAITGSWRFEGLPETHQPGWA